MPKNPRSRLSEDRDAAVLTALITVLWGFGLTMVALVLGAGATVILVDQRLHLPPFHTWLREALGVLADPAHPGTALEDPWARDLDRHVALYWITSILLGVVLLTATIFAAAWLYPRLSPPPRGHATRADIRRALSPAAARRSAEWTRPGLTRKQVRRAPVADYAAPLHYGPHNQKLVTTLETPTGSIAPTRGGKSRRDVVHKILDAPGALICSTTKPDLVEFAALARARRLGAGPVLVFDATGYVPWPARLRHSPITGCSTPQTALRRADTLVETAAVDIADAAGNDPIFRQRSKSVLQCYLLAANLSGLGVAEMTRWAISRPLDHAPVDILRAKGYGDLATNLDSEMRMVAETADAVWLAVRRVLEPFLDPGLRDLCTPRPGESFDPESFLRARGSLFLIADQDNPIARPVLSALLVELLYTQQRMALAEPTRRLDPPVVNPVDELLLGTPIPNLPGILADSAGRGSLIHWWVQSRAQLDQLYGENGARALVDNTLTLTVHSGIHDDKTLEWLSTLCGHHDRTRYQHHYDSLFTPARTGRSTETVPTLRPGAIRNLGDEDVLILHRNLPPIIGHTLDVRDRLDWPQLERDIATVRAGKAPVTADGYLTSRRAVQPLIDTTDHSDTR